MRKILEKCPACEGTLIVTELSCTQCDTTVGGRFRPTIFSTLSDENLRFLEVFVKNRGNVKEMERELGASYWTIRNKLNDVIAELGFDAPEEADMPERRAILRQVDEGKLSVQDAAKLLAGE